MRPHRDMQARRTPCCPVDLETRTAVSLCSLPGSAGHWLSSHQGTPPHQARHQLKGPKPSSHQGVALKVALLFLTSCTLD